MLIPLQVPFTFLSTPKIWTHTFLTGPVQCFAGYCDVKYGHLLEGEKQKGVIIKPIRSAIMNIDTEYQCSA